MPILESALRQGMAAVLALSEDKEPLVHPLKDVHISDDALSELGPGCLLECLTRHSQGNPGLLAQSIAEAQLPTVLSVWEIPLFDRKIGWAVIETKGDSTEVTFILDIRKTPHPIRRLVMESNRKVIRKAGE